KSSAHAIREAARHIEGRKINIRNVLNGQNLDIKYENICGQQIPMEVKKRLDPNCWDCLEGTEYISLPRSEAWTRFSQDTEFLMPMNLAECRALFRISTIAIETDDSTLISLALGEGCSGGWGTFPGRENIVTRVSADAQEKFPFILPHPSIVPVHITKVDPTGFGGSMNLKSTQEFWGMEPESLVRLIRVGDTERYGYEEGSRNEVSFIFLNGQVLALEFGRNSEAETLLWIDITKAREEPIRYLVDTGFRPLLLGEPDSIYFK
ncbi:MAG: hypothetical protein ABII22_04840, partial [Candidatus Micrarchaeota archaeon]